MIAPPPDNADSAQTPVVGRHRNLLGRTALVSVLTLLSRIAGFARESLTAALFGDASRISDALVSAWRVPNFFRALMAEGAIATAVQTNLTRVDHEHGEEAGRAFFRAMVRVVASVSALACVAGLALAWLAPANAEGSWLGRDPTLVREFLARMLPFVVLVCVSAVLAGALNVRGVFFAPNAAPVAMNIGWIIALVAIGGAHGWVAGPGTFTAFARELSMARWITAYVLVAGLLLVFVPVPALRGAGLAGGTSPLLRSAARARAWTALRESVPQAIGVSAHQCGSLFAGWMALVALPQGATSLLYYATRLQQLPLSLVAAAATNAVFPALAALASSRDSLALRELHARTQRAIAFVSIPASLGLFAFAEPILSVCFEHGAFGAAGVERSVWALRALALSIVPVGAAGLVARALYALGEVRAVVRAAVIVLAIYAGLGWLLAAPLGLDIAGFTIGGCVAAWVHVVLLATELRRRTGGRRARLPVGWGMLVAGSALVANGGAWFLHRSIATDRGATLPLALCIFLAVAGYAALCAALDVEEWRAVRERVSGRRGTSVD